MSGGFGRKGLNSGGGSSMPMQNRAPMRPQPHHSQAQQSAPVDDEMAARRAAFIASERARQSGFDQDGAPQHGGQSSGAYTNGATPASPDAFRQEHAPQQPHYYAPAKPERSLAIAYIFWFILGQISIHRFYLGAKESAIMQISLLFGSAVVLVIFMPLGILGLVAWVIWIFADLFLMPGLHRKYCSSTRENAAVFS